MIAAKIYLSYGTGLVLHVVYFQGSLYCVLADAVEDLPLLDVAFPDITARNRAVQVRTYSDHTAKKLAASHGPPGACPLPKCLRVWEGRRRGVAGVGYGAASALADAGSDAGAVIRDKARSRAQESASVSAVAASGSGRATSGVQSASTTGVAHSSISSASSSTVPGGSSSVDKDTAPVKAAAHREPAVDSKEMDGDDDDDIYDVSGMRAAVVSAGSGAGIAKRSEVAESKSSDAEAPVRKEPVRVLSELEGVRSTPTVTSASTGAASGGGGLSAGMATAARAPHHIAPLKSQLAADSNRLHFEAHSLSGGDKHAESKLAEAPWDHSGKPRV